MFRDGVCAGHVLGLERVRIFPLRQYPHHCSRHCFGTTDHIDGGTLHISTCTYFPGFIPHRRTFSVTQSPRRWKSTPSPNNTSRFVLMNITGLEDLAHDLLVCEANTLERMIDVSLFSHIYTSRTTPLQHTPIQSEKM